jgi:HIV-1 Vpr-binding protein
LQIATLIFTVFVNQVICPALNVLVNLVCPPPSISNKPSSTANQQPAAAQALVSESRDRNFEKSVSDRNLLANQGESRERSADVNPSERNNTLHQGTPCTPVVPSGVVEE